MRTLPWIALVVVALVVGYHLGGSIRPTAARMDGRQERASAVDLTTLERRLDDVVRALEELRSRATAPGQATRDSGADAPKTAAAEDEHERFVTLKASFLAQLTQDLDGCRELAASSSAPAEVRRMMEGTVPFILHVREKVERAENMDELKRAYPAKFR